MFSLINYIQRRRFENRKKAEVLGLIIKASMSYAVDEDIPSTRKYFEQACRAYDFITSSSKRIENELVILTLMLTGKRDVSN